MDSSGNIYQAQEGDIPQEDKDRLEEWLSKQSQEDLEGLLHQKLEEISQKEEGKSI